MVRYVEQRKYMDIWDEGVAELRILWRSMRDLNKKLASLLRELDPEEVDGVLFEQDFLTGRFAWSKAKVVDRIVDQNWTGWAQLVSYGYFNPEQETVRTHPGRHPICIPFSSENLRGGMDEDGFDEYVRKNRKAYPQGLMRTIHAEALDVYKDLWLVNRDIEEVGMKYREALKKHKMGWAPEGAYVLVSNPNGDRLDVGTITQVSGSTVTLRVNTVLVSSKEAMYSTYSKVRKDFAAKDAGRLWQEAVTEASTPGEFLMVREKTKRRRDAEVDIIHGVRGQRQQRAAQIKVLELLLEEVRKYRNSDEVKMMETWRLFWGSHEQLVTRTETIWNETMSMNPGRAGDAEYWPYLSEEGKSILLASYRSAQFMARTKHLLWGSYRGDQEKNYLEARYDDDHPFPESQPLPYLVHAMNWLLPNDYPNNITVTTDWVLIYQDLLDQGRATDPLPTL